MTFQKFKLYALAKKQIEYHSFNPNAKFQCVDLANFYIVNFWGLRPIIGTDAKDFPERLTPGMEFVKNTIDYLPEAGEVAVWSGKVGKGAGHIAVVLKKGLQTTFQSLDQNWSKPLFITEEKHTYANVRGFIRKKESMPDNALQECLKQHTQLVTQAVEKGGVITSLTKEIKTLKSDMETKDKQVSAQKGLVTQSEKVIYLQGIELSEAKLKIKELEKAEPIEAIKDPMRYVVSLVIGAAITWAYTQYPFLGQLGADQQAVAAFLIGLAIKGLDKYQFETGSNVKLPF